MRERRESEAKGRSKDKKKAPVSRGCVEVGFFVVGMTDAKEKRNGCTGREIFLSSQSDSFRRLLSGACPAAAADVFGSDLRRVCREDDGALEHMGQLTNVAGPRVLPEGVESAGQKALAGSVGAKPCEEMAGERGQVVETFAQCGNFQREDGEAVVEVETEGAVDDPLFKVTVRGGDDADVDARDLVIADALEFATLQEAEKLGLDGEREFADLVQEERASVRGFDAAGAGLDGSGEGAAGVAEELGLEKCLGDGSAVEYGEGL